MDSQCKYAMLASAGADIYLRLPVKPGYVEKIWVRLFCAVFDGRVAGWFKQISFWKRYLFIYFCFD
jgi:hypothetical protein